MGFTSVDSAKFLKNYECMGVVRVLGGLLYGSDEGSACFGCERWENSAGRDYPKYPQRRILSTASAGTVRIVEREDRAMACAHGLPWGFSYQRGGCRILDSAETGREKGIYTMAMSSQ